MFQTRLGRRFIPFARSCLESGEVCSFREQDQGSAFFLGRNKILALQAGHRENQDQHSLSFRDLLVVINIYIYFFFFGFIFFPAQVSLSGAWYMTYKFSCGGMCFETVAGG